jgi:hypothetical protein
LCIEFCAMSPNNSSSNLFACCIVKLNAQIGLFDCLGNEGCTENECHKGISSDRTRHRLGSQDLWPQSGVIPPSVVPHALSRPISISTVSTVNKGQHGPRVNEDLQPSFDLLTLQGRYCHNPHDETAHFDNINYYSVIPSPSRR